MSAGTTTENQATGPAANAAAAVGTAATTSAASTPTGRATTATTSTATSSTATSSQAAQGRRGVLPPGAAFAGVSVAFAGLYLAAGAPTPLLLALQERWGFPSWALTLAFGAYSLGLIAALLVFGRLSDFVGRRPVIVAALALELVAMIAFVFAPNIGWVVAARTVQGVATGAATSAFTAYTVELAPAHLKRLGAIVAGTAALGGLGLGSLLAGFAVQLTPVANTVVFTVLAVIMAGGLVVTFLAPETSTRRAGANRSLVPSLEVPQHARREFVSIIPAIIGSWMLGALVLGLGPTLVLDVFHIDSGAIDGLVTFAEPAAAAIMGLVLGAIAARRVVLLGTFGVIVGTLLVAAAVLTGWLPLFLVGGVIGGAGFGASFSGSLRTLTAAALPHERAGLFASLYVTAYLSFGVPVIVGGLLIAPLGLNATVIGYAAVIVAAGVVAASLLLAGGVRRARRERRQPVCPQGRSDSAMA